MEALIVGDSGAAGELAAGLAAEGIETRISVPGAPQDGVAGLGAAMIELERELVERRPAAVILADRGDRALAATLVATKLLVPALAVATDRRAAGGDNDRLVELLAEVVEAGRLPRLLRP